VRWEDGIDVKHIMHGHTERLILAMVHGNGIAYIQMRKWNIEPPLVLEETPTPSGGGATYSGIYPPLDLRDVSKTGLEALRFDFTVRISSDEAFVDHRVGIPLWGEPVDLT
jgi:hypothetical protein